MGETTRTVVGGGIDASVELFWTEHDWLSTTSILADVEAIASLKEVDSVTLWTDEGVTLHDYVDPETFDALDADGRANTVGFTVADYTVQIEGSELVVTRTEADPGV